MARPVKRRRICELPDTCEFAPCSKPAKGIVELTIDEFETIRLIDNLGLTQEDCSKQMAVARTTVQSIYDNARKKIADSLVNGKKLTIGGGSYDICPHSNKCCGKNCHQKGCSASPCQGGEACNKPCLFLDDEK